jgi:hypothetical protein
MTKWLAQQTLAKMRFDLSISRPGAAMNEKMALDMAIDALGVQQEEDAGLPEEGAIKNVDESLS